MEDLLAPKYRHSLQIRTDKGSRLRLVGILRGSSGGGVCERGTSRNFEECS